MSQLGTIERAPRGPIARWVRLRMAGAGAGLLLLLTLVCVRAYKLQVQRSDYYRSMSRRQHLRTVAIPAPRGVIYDARGTELAVTAEIASVFANPQEVSGVEAASARLARALGMEAAVIENRLSSFRQFEWIKRHISDEQARAVRALRLPGIEVTSEPRRFYPGGAMAGPVLGFANVDGKGTDGLELTLDALLTGQRAQTVALRDASGLVALAEGAARARPGASVTTTLDRFIQDVSQRAIEKAVVAHKARAASAVVLDVHTGAVLAIASVPNYDPNNPGPGLRDKARNRIVADAYEIGSSMKVFTVTAALDAGVIRPDSRFDVEGGKYRLGRRIIRDSFHDDILDVGGIIKRSSNVGAIKIAQRLGAERLHAALRAYGFGVKTGIELPGERAGLIRPPGRWGEIGLATISYGYGITATPLQVVAALAAVGNGGVYHPPRIVSRIVKENGEVMYQHESFGRRIMQERTARALLPMLASVFDKGKDGGTGRDLVVPGVRAGGKSGTSRKLDPETHTYSEEHYLSSFVGLAPIDEPRIAVLVLVDEPSEGHYYGAVVAGPAWAEITSETIRYLGLADPTAIESAGGAPPGQITAQTAGQPAAPTGAAAPTATAAAAQPAGATGTTPGAPPVLPAPLADPLEPVPEVPAPAEWLAEDPTAVRVPDLRGLGVARVLDEARRAGIEVEISGSGLAVQQVPPPGPAERPVVCRVVFSPDGARRGSAAPAAVRPVQDLVPRPEMRQGRPASAQP